MVFETLLIGLLLALLYVELTEISPGGLVVPGYMALYLDHPLRVLATLFVAIMALLAYRGLSRFLILFGRRRFVLMILLGAVLAQAWFFLLPHVFLGSPELRAIGWVIPGLLAGSLERQRPLPTLASLATVSILTYFLVRFVSWL
ncbi:MAG: poly-gamma-glutamate biosynthesis protein PgsC [Candidatus Aminicenantes bacterium]|jgi:poly-gamma-glutamate biosynthesis protein PgsC/CapC|nr:poly-gamma-glutamate biosynthesis protein PgsC [Candidatus Aminicenantes bacterium]